MREKGAEIRRFFCTPVHLRFGERPAGAVNGARGDDMVSLAGVVRRDGIVGGGNIDLDGARENVKGLIGFSIPSLLLFFDGEQNIVGSTFSLSKSSKVEASNGLFPGESTLFEDMILDLPLAGEHCAARPTGASIRS